MKSLTSPPDPTPKLSFEYEELTDQYVESESEKIDYDLNGLRRVTRTLIAIEGTEYNKDVGVDSIEHTALGYGTETLYLASVSEQAKDDNESGFTLIKEVWLQPGVIRESTRTESGGLVSKSITTWYDEPSISGGAVESVVKDNVEGFNVWTASVKERLDGQPITNGVAQEYEGYFDFQYPGVAYAFAKTVTFPGITARFCGVAQSPPITTPILATVTVKYFTGTTPPALQEDLWAPSDWAKLDATWINDEDQPRSKVEGIRGYRVGNLDSLTVTSGANALAAPFNEFVPVGNSVTISLTGGPENPEGNTYVINEPRAEFAFSDEDGTEYFRWVEVVATIPAGPIDPSTPPSP